MQIPRLHLSCSPNSLPHLLDKLGFVCKAGHPPSKKQRTSGEGIANLRGSSFKGRYTTFVSTDKVFTSWQLPRQYVRLLLDTAALSHVLKTGQPQTPPEGYLGGGEEEAL